MSTAGTPEKQEDRIPSEGFEVNTRMNLDAKAPLDGPNVRDRRETESFASKAGEINHPFYKGK